MESAPAVLPANDATPRRRFRPIGWCVDVLRRRPRWALCWYWAAAVVVTHVPPVFPRGPDSPLPPIIGKDKIAHLAGFCGLAYLLMNYLARRWWPRPVTVGVVVVTCAIYGAVDELTQPWFDRTADPADWVADMIGAAFGIILFYLFNPDRRLGPR